MNTKQIQRALEDDPFTKPLFRGVYAIDQLPKCNPGGYVINTDPSTQPGQHWIAVFVNKRKVNFFDSYGRKPPPCLKRWWNKLSWDYNPVSLQSPLSAVCGQYCIYYLLHRARGISLNEMLLDFCKDADHNDEMVHEFIEDRFDMQGLKLVDTKGVILQLAQAQINNPRIRNKWTGQRCCSSPQAMSDSSSEGYIMETQEQ